MALRTKSVEFAFDSRITTLGPATRHDFSSITLYSPENTSRTFRSAIIEINVRDNEAATGAFVTSFLIGIKLAAVAFDDSTVTGTISQFSTDSARSFVLTRDVTSYFNTNFGSGTSQTCQVGVQFGGMDTINITAKLILTYEYDDAATTQIKTVRIPLDGSTGNLTNTLTQLGTNQIPALDTFLPEASKTYRQIWFEVCANEADPNATDFSWGLQIDAGAEFNDGLHEAALSSAPFSRILWTQHSMTTNAAHAFNVRGTVTNRFNITNVIMYVTYEYDESSSTSIMNSLLLPLKNELGVMGFSSSTNLSRLQTSLLVEEANPVLAQSGVYMGWTINSDNGTFSGLNMRVGSQSFRAYTVSFSTFENNQGMWMMSQRLDSGGAQGSGHTLARGFNTVTVDCYNTSTQVKLNLLSGFLILNYTSDKHASGSGVHNHTTFWNIASSAFTGVNPHDTVITSGSLAPVIPETNYYTSNVSTVNYAFSGPFRMTFMIAGEIQSGEGAADGWRTVNAVAMQVGGGQAQIWFFYGDATDRYARYPNDPGTGRMGLETARIYRLITNSECYSGAYMAVTYHAISYTVQGSASNYAGDGSGITVKMFNSSTGEYLASTTTAVGGGFTMTWYDDTANIYVEGLEDSTHRGRSDDATAV
jgi:hypothetical protein